jgi:DNA-binding GntR family transcriptional regulator
MKKSAFSGVSEIVFAKEPLAERVFAFLEEGILSMKYIPGTVLNEYEISRYLGISRSPVRESLLRLEQAGMVNKNGKYRMVSNITQEDIRNNYELWEMVEPFCAMRSCLNASSQDLEKIQAVLTEMDKCNTNKHLEMYRDLNLKFHKFLVAPCTNKLLVDYHSQVIKRIRWGSNYSISLTNDSGHSNISHHVIFEAYSQKRQKDVEQLLLVHIREAAERIWNKFQNLKASSVSQKREDLL